MTPSTLLRWLRVQAGRNRTIRVQIHIRCSGAILLAAAATVLIWISTASAGQIRYRETTGDQSRDFTWRLERTDLVEVRVDRQTTSFVNRCEPGGETMAWEYRSPDVNVQAVRQGNTLKLWGHVRGVSVEEHHRLDEAPWYQPLSFSLRAFLHSDRRKTHFWMIRPDALEPVKLQATKKETEILDTAAGRFSARKVEVRLEGWLSFCWHGTYWYRTSDGLFLQYAGVNGLPGTPPTVVELVKILP